MDELIKGLIEKTGISEEQAAKVIEFLKENAGNLPQLLAGGDIKSAIADKLPGGLGGLL